MVQQHPSKDKKERSILRRAIDFIRNLFAPLINWFRSLFNPVKKKEETPVELKPAISNTAEVQQPVVETPMIKQETPPETKAAEVAEVREAEEKPNTEALLVAVKKGETGPLEALLKKADPEIIKKNPSVLLYAAIEAGHIDTIKLLMKEGLTLNYDCVKEDVPVSSSNRRHNALALAIEHQHIEVIKLCLDNQLPFKESFLRPLFGSSAKVFDTEKKLNIFKLLLDRTPFTFKDKDFVDNQRQEYGIYYLREAARIGHIASIKHALERNEIGDTIWPQEAINCNQLEIAKLFLDYTIKKPLINLDFLKPDSSFFRVNKSLIFFNAVKANHLELVKYLIENHPVDFNLEHAIVPGVSRCRSALYYAVANKKPEMVKLLLEDAGADFGEVEYTESEIEAIETYKKEFGVLLPSYKISYVVEQNKRRAEEAENTRLAEEAEKERIKAIEQQEKINAIEIEKQKKEKQDKKNLVTAIKECEMGPLEECLKSTDPEMIKKNAPVLLDTAMARGRRDIVELLMKYGVDLVDEQRYNALQLAIQHQHLDLINFCLDHNLPFHEIYLRPLVDDYDPVFKTQEKQAIFKVLLDRVAFAFREYNEHGLYSYGGYYLREAIKLGHIESIKRCFESGKMIKDFCSNAKEAIKHNQLELAKLFLTYSRNRYAALSEFSKREELKEEQAIFINAVKSNNLEVVKLLLNLDPVKIDLDVRMDLNLQPTALYHAIQNRQHEMVQLLIDAGAGFGDRKYSKAEVDVINLYQNELRNRVLDNDPSLQQKLSDSVLNIVFDYAYGSPSYRVEPQPKSRKPRS